MGNQGPGKAITRQNEFNVRSEWSFLGQEADCRVSVSVKHFPHLPAPAMLADSNSQLLCPLGWLKQQKFIFSILELECPRSRCHQGLVPNEGSFPGLQMADFSLSPYIMVFPQCMQGDGEGAESSLLIRSLFPS